MQKKPYESTTAQKPQANKSPLLSSKRPIIDHDRLVYNKVGVVQGLLEEGVEHR